MRIDFDRVWGWSMYLATVFALAALVIFIAGWGAGYHVFALTMIVLMTVWHLANLLAKCVKAIVDHLRS